MKDKKKHDTQGLCSSCRGYLNRSLTVDGLIIDKDSLLLVKRKKDPAKGKWALPGGYVDLGETTEEAVKREIVEETGLVAVKTELLAVFDDPKRHPDENIALLFRAEVKGALKLQEEEVSQLKYFPIKSLPVDLAFDHRNMIEYYLKNSSDLKSRKVITVS